MIQVNQVGNMTEISVVDGYLTESFPTNFHHFYKKKMLTANENVEDFIEVTETKKADLEASDAVWERPPQLFIDQWNVAAGDYGCYNENTGFYELNGIQDLTYDNVIVILDAGRLTGPNGESFYGQNSKLRTNLPPISCWDVTSLSHTSWGCTSLEVFNARKCRLGYAAFAGCKKLHTIISVLNNEGGNINTCFDKCEALKSLKLKLSNKATSFSLSFSPLIDLASFQYIVTNAANASALTITVHPDVYAKLTDESNEEWHSLLDLAVSKNIQFITT